ncbi:hypothetical protein ACSQ67_013256 [Phaseolus vulgaris]
MDRAAPLGFNPCLSIYIAVTSSSDLRLPYLALYHELLRHLARRSAMTGVKGLKILILQQQRPTFSCTCLRNLRSRANHALVLLAENRDDPALVLCSIMFVVASTSI